MNIPELRPSERAREYNLYTDIERAKIVHGWLFERKTHRELDEEFLGLDRDISRGYQAMGVLHFLGLKKEFHGIFNNVSKTLAISVLQENEQDFSEIIRYLGMI